MNKKMESKFNIYSHSTKVINIHDRVSFFRGQPYPEEKGQEWGPVYFSSTPKRNRWTPLIEDCGGSAYFGLDKQTAFFESFPTFREMDIRANGYNFPIGYSELIKMEMIEFCFKKDIKLIDLTVSGAFLKHRVNRSITCSQDLELSNEMATEAFLLTDVDGIHYESKFGGKTAIVLFDRGSEVYNNFEVIQRQSFYDYAISNIEGLERELCIELINDIHNE